MEIFIAMGVFFILVTAVFVAIAVFFPEWVGITGNRAKESMREQQGDSILPNHLPPQEKNVDPIGKA